MEMAGLSMALGAFLAGVLLAGSEYKHALETDLEPFKGLLLGLFFMAVGMTVDFGLWPGIQLGDLVWFDANDNATKDVAIPNGIPNQAPIMTHAPMAC